MARPKRRKLFMGSFRALRPTAFTIYALAYICMVIRLIFVFASELCTKYRAHPYTHTIYPIPIANARIAWVLCFLSHSLGKVLVIVTTITRTFITSHRAHIVIGNQVDAQKTHHPNIYLQLLKFNKSKFIYRSPSPGNTPKSEKYQQ